MRGAHFRERRVRALQIEQRRRVLDFDVLFKVVVHHRHRRAAAARETLHELHAEFSIRRNRHRIPVPAVLFVLPLFQINPRRLRDCGFQLIAPRHRARERAADADVPFPGRLPAKHRIERHQFQHVDRRKLQLRRDPRDAFIRNVPEMFLPKMQQRQRRTAFRDGVMRDRFVYLRQQFGRNIHGTLFLRLRLGLHFQRSGFGSLFTETHRPVLQLAVDKVQLHFLPILRVGVTNQG